jgi:hypothetical protein
MRVSLAAMTTTGFGSRPVYLDRAIYTTITVMSVLILYDGCIRCPTSGQPTHDIVEHLVACLPHASPKRPASGQALD